VAYPAPFAFLDGFADWTLAGSLPQFYVRDLVRPPDAEDVSQALVDERLDLVGDGVGYSPCLRPIQEDCFYICVEDADLAALG
jgi:hypothetical protein